MEVAVWASPANTMTEHTSRLYACASSALRSLLTLTCQTRFARPAPFPAHCRRPRRSTSQCWMPSRSRCWGQSGDEQPSRVEKVSVEQCDRDEEEPYNNK
jgi:hypothetical protein